MSTLLTVEEALEAILGRVALLEAESVPILESLGRVLVEDVVAGEAIPAFVSAAMDGYAVRGEEVAGASPGVPVKLRVVGEIVAGAVSTVTVVPGTAGRIMTGAPLPPGSDTVVPLELADEDGMGWVHIRRAVQLGRHVRQVGEDVSQGEQVFQRGLRLRPQDVGSLAALGRVCIQVTRRPRVAVLSTGDELVEVGQPLPLGKTHGSNAYANCALVRKYGGEPLKLPLTGDHPEEILARIDESLDWGADLVLTSGGTALGVRDLLRQILTRRGKLFFWQVRMQPGRPVLFGEICGVPLLGLPGRPTSNLVAFEVLARPALLRMQGQRALRKPEVAAVLLKDVRAYPDRVRFLWAVVEASAGGGYLARLGGPSEAGRMSTVVRANGLLRIPPRSDPTITAGSTVQAMMLDWPEVE